MPEDKLTKQERIRLEAFSQAVNSSFTIQAHGSRPTIEELFELATKIETFLKASNPN